MILLFAIAMGTIASCGSVENERPKGKDNTKASPDVNALFDQKCGICHGRDGKLMVGGAPDLSKSEMSLADRIVLITNGKGTMPPQKDVLSKEQIVALAKYIDRFK
ncbi:MAG: cytochrome c [Bacteroidota bacterium]